MAYKKTDISSYPKHSESPFIANLLIDKKTKTKYVGKLDEKVIVDTETGETDTVVIGFKKEVDQTEFVKVYTSQIAIIFELSKTAQKVLSYIWSEQSYGDRIVFDLQKCMDYTKLKSKASISLGITELLESEIIARGSVTSLFFTNPAIFYKGDRLLLITEYRKKYEPKTNLKKIKK